MSSGCSPLGQGHTAQNQRGTDGFLKGERLVEDEDAQQWEMTKPERCGLGRQG